MQVEPPERQQESADLALSEVLEDKLVSMGRLVEWCVKRTPGLLSQSLVMAVVEAGPVRRLL